ncbi:hypothetical protein [Paracoccus sp. AS002]|uniref:hypothetical protein n=1 Tax=Paracoccus sp. AS002 TaxID=3019545 RepID=UPI0023E79FC9|nr:hypothetical protein [Paracoccus sp. AS002]MDF3903409.1 hypothetical protein [Paracoccus sp. AS002]
MSISQAAEKVLATGQRGRGTGKSASDLPKTPHFRADISWIQNDFRCVALSKSFFSSLLGNGEDALQRPACDGSGRRRTVR